MFLFNDRVVWYAHLPRSHLNLSFFTNFYRDPATADESSWLLSKSYLIDDHPRDHSSGCERTTALCDASEMSEVPRRACVS